MLDIISKIKRFQSGYKFLGFGFEIQLGIGSNKNIMIKLRDKSYFKRSK